MQGLNFFIKTTVFKGFTSYQIWELQQGRAPNSISKIVSVQVSSNKKKIKKIIYYTYVERKRRMYIPE